MKYFVDTETVGFYGQPVLLQYAIDDGPIILHNLWDKPIGESLSLIDDIANNEVIAYNLNFDWYKLNQFYTTFVQADKNLTPRDISFLAFQKLEQNGLFQGILKPKSCLDLMVVVLEDKYQHLLFKQKMTIRKVPTVLADSLIKELSRIEFPNIMFAKYKDETQRWKRANPDKEFTDVQIQFRPSFKLKDLCRELGLTSANRDDYNDAVTVGKVVEYGYRPYGWMTESSLNEHLDYWYTNERGRKYAYEDVNDLRNLYKHLDCPPPDDTNSVLTAMVACCKWKGFSIDKDALEKLKENYKKVASKEDVNYDAQDSTYKYISESMSEIEKNVFLTDGKISCAVEVLEEVERMKDVVICPACQATELECTECDGEGFIEDGEHPAVERARRVLAGRRANKRIDLVDKFINGGRFHASFNVIGTLSNRMSGGSGKSDKSVNSQGIPHEDEFRACFPLADEDEFLAGGDFDAFEVAIMCACYNDPDLIAELKTGKKVHGIFGSFLFNKTYEEILATKGTSNDLYLKGKTAVFALCYGGQAYTISKQANCTLEQAQRGYDLWFERFPNFRSVFKKVEDDLSLIVSDGKGFKRNNLKRNYAESLLGTKRYYRIELQMIDAIWNLINNPPKDWGECEIEVIRKEHKGVQMVGNALMSALFGFMFSIQNGMLRAALNHTIQATGAKITKELQIKQWGLQPHGFNPWVIRQLNIHDEIMAVCDSEETINKSIQITNDFILEYGKLVPLLAMKWQKLNAWAEKV